MHFLVMVLTQDKMEKDEEQDDLANKVWDLCGRLKEAIQMRKSVSKVEHWSRSNRGKIIY